MPNADNDPRRRARQLTAISGMARIPLADLRDQSPPNLQASTPNCRPARR